VPAIVLGFGTFAYITRLTRNSMLEVMGQDYVRTARAKGLGGRVIITRHMLRNALIPVMTIMGPALAGLDHRLVHHRDHVRFSGQRA
jgi:oligopeptide transport system permease protein